MARPRTIDADIVLAFHCSYGLKAATARAAKLSSGGNASTFIRRALERSCLEVLGETVWAEVQSAASKPIRQQLLEAFLQGREVNRLRPIIDAAKGKAVEKSEIVESIDAYLREFEVEARNDQTGAALSVALEEALDLLRKMRTIFGTEELTAGQFRALRRLAASLPLELRADFDAAILEVAPVG